MTRSRSSDRYGIVALCLVAGCATACLGAPAAGDTASIGGLRMVWVPAGSFTMGTDKESDVSFTHCNPVHRVELDGFWMSATEITQAQYRRVTGVNPSLFKGDSLRPVDQVSWYDAIDFCNELSRQSGLEHCYRLASHACYYEKDGFRLPTEAEWEYACRAGTDTRYYTGERESDLARAGWYLVNSAGSTHPVGRKVPNAWGLYDMHGNVWEWCNDWMAAYTARERKNPSGPLSGDSKVLRGGGWHYDALGCSSVFRHRAEPQFRLSMVGFRVVCRAAASGDRAPASLKPSGQ